MICWWVNIYPILPLPHIKITGTVRFFLRRLVNFQGEKLIIYQYRMLLATKWACEYCSSYHGWRAMLISLEASKLSIFFNISTTPGRSATTTEPIGLAIGAYIYSPDPLHYPKISTRNVINWIRNELISSGIHLTIFTKWLIFVLHIVTREWQYI